MDKKFTTNKGQRSRQFKILPFQGTKLRIDEVLKWIGNFKKFYINLIFFNLLIWFVVIYNNTFSSGTNFSSTVCLETWPLKYRTRYPPPYWTLYRRNHIVHILAQQASVWCLSNPPCSILSHCCIIHIVYSTAYGHSGCFHSGSIKIIPIRGNWNMYFVPSWFGINQDFHVTG